MTNKEWLLNYINNADDATLCMIWHLMKRFMPLDKDKFLEVAQSEFIQDIKTNWLYRNVNGNS